MQPYLIILGLMLVAASWNNTKIVDVNRPLGEYNAGKLRFHARLVQVSPDRSEGVLENVNTQERINVALADSQKLTEYGRAVVAITDRATLVHWEKIIDQHYIGKIEDVQGVYAIINGHPYKIRDRASLLAGRTLIGRRAFGQGTVIRTSN